MSSHAISKIETKWEQALLDRIGSEKNLQPQAASEKFQSIREQLIRFANFYLFHIKAAMQTGCDNICASLEADVNESAQTIKISREYFSVICELMKETWTIHCSPLNDDFKTFNLFWKRPKGAFYLKDDPSIKYGNFLAASQETIKFFSSFFINALKWRESGIFCDFTIVVVDELETFLKTYQVHKLIVFSQCSIFENFAYEQYRVKINSLGVDVAAFERFLNVLYKSPYEHSEKAKRKGYDLTHHKQMLKIAKHFQCQEIVNLFTDWLVLDYKTALILSSQKRNQKKIDELLSDMEAFGNLYKISKLIELRKWADEDPMWRLQPII